jgi:hypothetical protein
LDEYRVFERHSQDVEEETRVFSYETHIRVRRGIVWHEEEEEDKYQILKAKSDPVYVAPPNEFGDDAGKETGKEHAEEHARDNNAKRSRAAMRRSEIANEWKHELRRYGGDGCDEGDGAERSKGFRDAKSDPVDISKAATGSLIDSVP